MIRASYLAFGLLLAGAATVPAAADDATLLGTTKDWSALTSGTGSDKVCYAMAKPHASDPRKIKRDPIYFLVTDWPSRHTKSEPEAVPGYQYKDGAAVTAQVGADKFEFFTQNDGTAGSAWIRKRNDEVRLVEAMRNGQNLVVTGTSKRGTVTKDTYSLAGLGDALDRIHKECGM
ncbi:MAG TPA: invasion associated locus B family protein [Rhizomicrobium sp.]|jgi:hypothetical protein|nr:invasion associated locus B family protein [Rhizomicrobium sp.]